jgi:hypothetical protein
MRIATGMPRTISRPPNRRARTPPSRVGYPGANIKWQRTISLQRLAAGRESHSDFKLRHYRSDRHGEDRVLQIEHAD